MESEGAAIALLKRAVELDMSKRYTESIVCYKEGLQLLLHLSPPLLLLRGGGGRRQVLGHVGLDLRQGHAAVLQDLLLRTDAFSVL